MSGACTSTAYDLTFGEAIQKADGKKPAGSDFSITLNGRTRVTAGAVDRAVVEMLAGVAVEVLEGALGRLEELTQSLIGERAEEASVRESERQSFGILWDDRRGT